MDSNGVEATCRHTHTSGTQPHTLSATASLLQFVENTVLSGMGLLITLRGLREVQVLPGEESGEEAGRFITNCSVSRTSCVQ